jgi:hypothetical protein
VPVGTVDPTATVIVDDGVEDDTVDGLNETVTPDGAPEEERVAVPGNSLMGVRLIVEAAVFPWKMERELGFALRLKSAFMSQTCSSGPNTGLLHWPLAG